MPEIVTRTNGSSSLLNTVACALLLLVLFASTGDSAAWPQVTVDTATFRLRRAEEDYRLEYRTPDGLRRLDVPLPWLAPAAEAAQDFAYVDSFSYDEAVTSFEVGRDLVGLHLSSYAIKSQGSAGVAAGRDVFLLLDSESRELSRGLIDLGVTKSRARIMGCFAAVSHSFLVADVNQDGRQDLGVIREEMRCEERRDPEGIDGVTGPHYSRAPVRWYVCSPEGWSHDAETPVDFVREVTGVDGGSS